LEKEFCGGAGRDEGFVGVVGVVVAVVVMVVVMVVAMGMRVIVGVGAGGCVFVVRYGWEVC
jgi:hypothetical protein